MSHTILQRYATRTTTIRIHFKRTILQRGRLIYSSESLSHSLIAHLRRKVCSSALILVSLVFLGPQLAIAEPSLERGTYLVRGPSGCGNCHTPMGPDGFVNEMELAGRLVEDLPVFTAIAPNLTPAGPIAAWSDTELARSIREGIRPDGTVLGPPMPIILYRGLSDDDLMSIVMYLRQLEPVDNDPGTSTYRIELPPAYGPPVGGVASMPQGVNVEYGEYLANAVAHCMECHTTQGEQGPMFDTHLGAGGLEFQGPWGRSVASNITPVGIAQYTDDQLSAMIQQGVRPDGRKMLPPMPYYFFSNMTDDDVDAVILYLRQLPPKGG
ncbi:MAG: c-type cytochrome [Rhodothermales bacterium]|nr:c-type cytochrome [Rhodothermales bacterium]